jgi:hypothetical protein
MSIHSFISKNPIVLLQPARVTKPLNWVQHIPFAFYVIKALQPKIFVELGVHTGNSFNAFCQVIQQEGLSCKCYGVDLWRGDEHAGFYENEIYNVLASQVKDNYEKFAELIRKDFNQAVNDFADKSIDLLHIDGLHSYEAVLNDFNVWLPKMSENGVILFHDTQVRERGFGVYRFWKEVTAKFPNFEFKFGNGLGVLAIGKEVNQAFLNFLEEAKKDKFIPEAFQYVGSRIFYQEEVERMRQIIEKYEKKRQKYYYFTHPFLFISRMLRGKLNVY